MTVELLRIPQALRSVSDLLAVADKMDLPNAVMLSELENGSLLILNAGDGTTLTISQVVYFLERAKLAVMGDPPVLKS